MKYKKQIQLIAAIVTLIVFPVITFYLMEAYTHNPFEEVRPWAQFFNILLFELLAWIFVSVTGKIQSGLSPPALPPKVSKFQRSAHTSNLCAVFCA